MIEIKIPVVNSAMAVAIIDELRKESLLVQGVDFDWSYHKGHYDDDYSNFYPPAMSVRFHTEEYATMFQLKYL